MNQTAVSTCEQSARVCGCNPGISACPEGQRLLGDVNRAFTKGYATGVFLDYDAAVAKYEQHIAGILE